MMVKRALGYFEDLFKMVGAETEVVQTPSTVRFVVFPVAGTSLDRLPKLDSRSRYAELKDIAGKSAMELALDEALSVGLTQPIFVTGSEKEGLEDHILELWNDRCEAWGGLRRKPIIVRQTKRQGIGDAIRSARGHLSGESFAVMIPTLLLIGGRSAGIARLLANYRPNAACVGLVTLPADRLHRFGVVSHDGDKIDTIVEKPDSAQAPSNLASFGRWVLPPEILPLLDQQEGDDVSLTKALNQFVKTHHVQGVKLEGAAFDLRTQEGSLKATVALALRDPEIAVHVHEVQRNFLNEGIRTKRSDAMCIRYDGLHPMAILSQSILADFTDGIALVSSFGAESVVLLHMVARIAPDTPVLFLQTGKLFAETLSYQEQLTARLRLTRVRWVTPDPDQLAATDPDGLLHRLDPELCCQIRKADPLQNALNGFSAWITGRKRFQGGDRSELPLVEEDPDGRTKVNPLIEWSRTDLDSYIAEYNLPPHPLIARGYRSIGCAPCTSPTAPGEDERAGRWRGSEKTECGIHLKDGRLVRADGLSQS